MQSESVTRRAPSPSGRRPDRRQAVGRWAAIGLTLAFGALGWAVAHRLAYGLHEAADGGHGHGYLRIVELAATLASITAIAALALQARRNGAFARPTLSARLTLGCAAGASVSFLLVELGERSFASAPPAVVLVAGVVLQAALVSAALVAARGAGTVVVFLAGHAPARRWRTRRSRGAARPQSSAFPRLPLLAAGGGSRAPPAA